MKLIKTLIVSCTLLAIAPIDAISPVNTPLAFCEEKVIVVDESGAFKHSVKKPGKDAKVITLKGKSGKAGNAGGGDVCESLGSRFYCAHKGEIALEKGTKETLGMIAGVTWLDKGATISRYLPPEWQAREAGSFLDLNVEVGHEGFFYIITAGEDLTFMVEVSRIMPQEK